MVRASCSKLCHTLAAGPRSSLPRFLFPYSALQGGVDPVHIGQDAQNQAAPGLLHRGQRSHRDLKQLGSVGFTQQQIPALGPTCPFLFWSTHMHPHGHNHLEAVPIGLGTGRKGEGKS